MYGCVLGHNLDFTVGKADKYWEMLWLTDYYSWSGVLNRDGICDFFGGPDLEELFHSKIEKKNRMKKKRAHYGDLVPM